MKIAMFSWETLHSVAVGGVAAHVSELSAALERRGHEVHVFTRHCPGKSFYDRIDGVHYHRCEYAPHPDFVDGVNNMCTAMVNRFFIVEDMTGRFDVVHAHDWLTANALIWIKQGRDDKYSVFTIHSTEYARCGNAFPPGSSHRVRDQERAGTYWADKVVAVSHTTRREIEWMYEVPSWKTEVIYNGVSPDRFDLDVDVNEIRRQYDIGPLDPTVLFCGRLEWQKGPDILMESLPHITSRFANAKFIFAGEGGMRQPIEDRARHLGVWDSVRFLGYRNGSELPRIFKMSDCVCVPSRNEPFGIVVLEAWSSGKPVVVTQVGGPSEYVEHEYTGLKIHPNPDSVTWGMNTLFSNFDHARWMGDNGKQAVHREFTWDIIARRMLGAYGVPENTRTEPTPVPVRRTKNQTVEERQTA